MSLDGLSQPADRRSLRVKEQNFSRRPVAQLAGVAIFEITADGGQIPEANCEPRFTRNRQAASRKTF